VIPGRSGPWLAVGGGVPGEWLGNGAYPLRFATHASSASRTSAETSGRALDSAAARLSASRRSSVTWFGESETMILMRPAGGRPGPRRAGFLVGFVMAPGCSMLDVHVTFRPHSCCSVLAHRDELADEIERRVVELRARRGDLLVRDPGIVLDADPRVSPGLEPA
jgi:hypothetical protein